MRKAGIRLLVLDFDGTALGGYEPYGRFPKPLSRFLDSLSKKGIRWASNTTWSIENQIDLFEQSPVKSLPLFLSASSGRRIAVPHRGRLRIDAQHDRRTFARDQRFREANWGTVQKALLKVVREGWIEQLKYNDFSHNILSFKASRGHARKVWRALDPLIRSGAFYAWSPARGVSGTLLPHYMNKGIILSQMQERFGVKPDETIVAGDGVNDLPMLDSKLAKWMVCPGNSLPMVKKTVSRNGGVLARKRYSDGVIEGVEAILKKAKAEV